jgi:hypothetical protein
MSLSFLALATRTSWPHSSSSRLTQGEWVPVSMAMRIGGCSEAKGRKEKARAKEGSTKRGQGHYKGRSPKASARLAPKSGRDGGGKPRPDYGLPNLTSWPLSVVNIRCSAFKHVSMRADVCFDAATEGATGGRQASIPPVVVAN